MTNGKARPTTRGIPNEKCGVCGGSLEQGYRYIYPVPEPHRDPLHPLQVGLKACVVCAPDLIEAQIAQGLIETVA